MAIRFKCPNCKKPLVVKDHLAGKKAACPVCKKASTIPDPAATAAEVEALAAAALGDDRAAQAGTAEAAPPRIIEFNCPFCDEPQKAGGELAGKQTPCTECRRIIKVPIPKLEKPKDWRDVAKQGPTAALINLPEQLDGAWGTEQRTRVSSTALVEAEALPEAELEPVGVLGWLRRGFWTALILSVIYLGYHGIAKMVSVKKQANDFLTAQGLMASEEFLERAALSPLHLAEMHRAMGEFMLRKGDANKARDEFFKARERFRRGKEVAFQDIFLIELASAQVELGGPEASDNAKKFSWKDRNIPRKELTQTLDRMLSIEGKAAAIREIANRLAEQNMLEKALGLVEPGGGSRSPLAAFTAALAIARDNKKEMALLPPPPTPGQPIENVLIRLAYAEGWARQGDAKYREVLDLVKAPGSASDRVQAAVAAASVILANSKVKNAAAETAPFILDAVAAAAEVKKDASSWDLLQLIRVGARTEASAELQSLVERLGPALIPWAKLYLLEGKLARTTERVHRDQIDNISDDPSHPAFALAWERFGRHNARHGYAGDVRLVLGNVPEAMLPFIHIGLALGEQDAGR